MLPRGAKITAITFDYCDTNITFGVTGYLEQVDEPAGANLTAYPSSGVSSSGTPGCASMGADLTSYNIVINNLTKSYWVRVALDTADLTTKLRGATVFYRLQVSPAPVIATFSDVPTSHLFFQYIEALAAAGITAGCGGGNYCPDSPVTRGQMAVFLARALGLHWAP